MSNTRGSVSSDIQTPEKHIQKARSNILNTVSSDISKHLEVIYQTLEGVFHLISKHLAVIYQKRVGVFHLISKHLEVIYQTRERVFHLISRH